MVNGVLVCIVEDVVLVLDVVFGNVEGDCYQLFLVMVFDFVGIVFGLLKIVLLIYFLYIGFWVKLYFEILVVIQRVGDQFELFGYMVVKGNLDYGLWLLWNFFVWFIVGFWEWVEWLGDEVILDCCIVFNLCMGYVLLQVILCSVCCYEVVDQCWVGLIFDIVDVVLVLIIV